MAALTALAVSVMSPGHGNMIHPQPRSSHGKGYDDTTKCGSLHPYSNASSPGYYCGTGCLGNACLYYQIGCYIGCDICSMVGKDLYPTETDFKLAGNCTPSEPSLPNEMRTYNVDDESWKGDWTRSNPWRSPGLTGLNDVNFQPCGVNSGGSKAFPGPGDGVLPHSAPGVDLPRLLSKPVLWKAGSIVNVSWSIYANHGGGYSYRICKVDGDAKPTEKCFQKNPLDFADNFTTVYYADGSRPNVTFPAMTTSIGTYPPGSMWRRNPVPMCNCDIGVNCKANDAGRQVKEIVIGSELDIGHSGSGCQAVPQKSMCGTKYTDNCLACAPGTIYNCTECCPGCQQVSKGVYTYCVCESPGPSPGPPSPPSPANGYFTPYKSTHLKPGQQTPHCPTGLMFETAPGWDEGYGEGTSSTLGGSENPYVLVDKVRVPHVPPGAYQLSWRWDTEQTPQVWNSCADIVITE